jgi:CRISPR system Cascade subunit CasD
MPHTLLFPLAGPMQSWGSRSRFEDRDTHLEPTKSGVLGLLCSALGRGRGEPLDDLVALRLGVRTELPGRPQTDYQTAQDVRTADGGMKDTVLSTRHYLADARFLIGLEGEDLALLQELGAALRNPVWTLSLGRKSYPLSLPPYFPEETCGGSLREHTSLSDALRTEPWWQLSRREQQPNPMRLLLEDSTGSDVFSDAPLNFQTRRFSPRRVRVEILTGTALPEQKEHPCIFPS